MIKINVSIFQDILLKTPIVTSSRKCLNAIYTVIHVIAFTVVQNIIVICIQLDVDFNSSITQKTPDISPKAYETFILIGAFFVCCFSFLNYWFRFLAILQMMGKLLLTHTECRRNDSLDCNSI